MRTAFVLVVLSVGVAPLAFGQSADPPRASVGLAMLYAYQTDAEGQPGAFSIPPKGRSGGAGLFAAVAVAPRIAVGAEFSFAGPARSEYSSSHPSSTDTVTAEHRDRMLNGVVRIRAAQYAEIVAGAGVSWSTTTATQVSRVFYQGWTEYSRTKSLDGAHLALTAGADFPIPLGRHVALLPTARFYYVRRPSVPSDTFDRPVLPPGAIVFRGGGGLAVIW